MRSGSADLAPEKVARWKRWALSKAGDVDPELSGQLQTIIEPAGGKCGNSRVSEIQDELPGRSPAQ